MEVGDVVRYVPYECHALEMGPDGDYPYVFGLKTYRPLPKGGVREEVEELSPERLREYLKFLQRHPNPEEERKKLVILRVAQTWEGVVREVHEDGTASLDVKGNVGGVTLHVRVRKDELGTVPHTCHKG
jgi:hypothetical protein